MINVGEVKVYLVFKGVFGKRERHRVNKNKKREKNRVNRNK